MTDANARMQEKLRKRVKEAADLGPPADVAPPLPAEVRLPAGDIVWLPREKGQTYMLSIDGVFCIEGSRVEGAIVYTAWKRSTLHKWRLGSCPDVPACKELCETAVTAVPADAHRYDLETDLTRFAKELSGG